MGLPTADKSHDGDIIHGTVEETCRITDIQNNTLKCLKVSEIKYGIFHFLPKVRKKYQIFDIS